MEVVTRPYLVFLCSAFVLPGLGQLISGQRVKGMLMIAATTLWFALAGAYFIWRASLISMALAQAGEPVSLTVLRAGLAPYASHFLFSLAILGALWLWSAADALLWARGRSRGLKSPAAIPERNSDF